MVLLGVGKYSVYQLNSLIVTLNRPNAVLGLATTSVLSGLLAIIFYHLLKKLGWDYLIAKSVGFGLVSWVFLEGLFVWIIEGPGLIPPRPINDYYVHMIGSVVFGISLGLLFRKYLLKKQQVT
ncbi:MAG: hypothetical protein SCK29_10850 [Bacillota bacterium]|nr:hypothetical protein [Bacillota bacterium]MDW7684601.1 hypothetical protein [Bacillota bacterium]